MPKLEAMSVPQANARAGYVLTADFDEPPATDEQQRGSSFVLGR
jgi:hypothetical protein